MTKHPIKVHSRVKASVALDLMRQEQVHHLLVIDKDKLKGVVSHSDLRVIDALQKRLKPKDKLEITVAHLMTKNPVTVGHDALMTEAMKVMAEQHCHCVPVVDGTQQLVGLVTSADTLRYGIIAQQRLEMDSLRSPLTKK